VFEASRTRIFGHAIARAELTSATWSPDDLPRDAFGMALTLGSRPLTCHFVTYSLQRRLAAIFNH
jgi:hypothetical protein